MNSDTPETDAASVSTAKWVEPPVCGSFARKLERERNAAIQSAKDNSANFRRSEVKRIEAERERDEAIKQMDAAKEESARLRRMVAADSAEVDAYLGVCDERDELERKIATDFMAGVVIELEAERDQLRKVCDSQSEMIKWYVKEFGMPRWGFEFDKLQSIDNAYNQLPHVKGEE